MIDTHVVLVGAPVYLIYCILSTWWQSALYSCRCTALYSTVHCTQCLSLQSVGEHGRCQQQLLQSPQQQQQQQQQWGGQHREVAAVATAAVVLLSRMWGAGRGLRHYITARQHQRYLWTLLAIRPANGVHQPRPHQHRHLYTFLCELRTSDIIIMWESWEIWTDKKVDSHSSRYVSRLYVKIFERMSWVKLCVAYIAFYISLFLADLSRYVI